MQQNNFRLLRLWQSNFWSAYAWSQTSSLGSIIHKALIIIYSRFVLDRYEEATAAKENLNCFLDKIPKGLHKENFLGAAQEKYMLSLRGLGKEYTTSNYRYVNDEEKNP